MAKRKKPAYPPGVPVFQFRHCSGGEPPHDVVFVDFTFLGQPGVLDREFPLRVINVGDEDPEQTGIVMLTEVKPYNRLAKQVLAKAKELINQK